MQFAVTWYRYHWDAAGTRNSLFWWQEHIYCQYHCCWLPGDARSQAISSRGIDLVSVDYSSLSTIRIKKHVYKSHVCIRPISYCVVNNLTELDQYHDSPDLARIFHICETFKTTSEWHCNGYMKVCIYKTPMKILFLRQQFFPGLHGLRAVTSPLTCICWHRLQTDHESLF